MGVKDDAQRKGEQKKKLKRKHHEVGAGPFSLLADESAVDPTLSSLFAPQVSVDIFEKLWSQDTNSASQPAAKLLSKEPSEDEESDRVANPTQGGSKSDAEVAESHCVAEQPINGDLSVSSTSSPEPEFRKKRKRKRKEGDEEVEDAYMRRLAQEDTKEAESLAKSNALKRPKTSEAVDASGLGAEDDELPIEVDEDEDPTVGEDENDLSLPPPRHETEQAADDELSKANRTVFLGNVSTAAISSKNARKALINHLKSFFESIAPPADGAPKHAVESLRFRSTPYSNSIPKKAAFATKQLMDATAKSTNAYAVYSSSSLAREAAKHLNATVVVGRHLRVDSVAHPAQVDNRRCVFVGNLGFVDDESNIQAANEEEGKETRKPGKFPADIEEGLWRTFGKCGTVESVRVVRDSTTRVGKGIAYVQFDDANAVEAALLYDGKKFPPMLPRKLRVSRAKAPKRNTKPDSSASTSRPKNTGYQRKVTSQEASRIGRANKLFGRAAAAQMKKDNTGGRDVSNGTKTPEKLVFEGHRASIKGGKSGLKLGKPGKKKPGKPTTRSAKRGAAFKAVKKTKAP